MSKDWYPVIDYDRCTGCMACHDLCRHGVYKPDGPEGKPRVEYGMGCVPGCRACQRQCPQQAIRYWEDDGSLDIGYDYDSYKPAIRCTGKPKVAFVCVHNSCRSQIAEALGKKLAGDVFESYSAGTTLKDHINPDAVRMMKQLYGIDMEQTQYNKLIENIPQPDVVIFMGCNVSCPYLPCQYAENWGLEDPTGQDNAFFADVIASIHEKVLALKEKLR